MKLLFISLFIIIFSAANAQNEIAIDTIFAEKTPIALLKRNGTGFVAYTLDGKERLISIKENYYCFANGLIAYPDVTVRSAEKTLEVINSNKLFGKNGLDNNNVKTFISRYPTPLPVQPLQRESRQELTTEPTQ